MAKRSIIQNGRPWPNVANTMQNDRFKFQTVANTRQMPPGKKAKNKVQNLRHKHLKKIYTHKRIAIRWHQSPTLKQDLRYLLYWLQRVSFPTFPPQELPLQISNGIHSVYSQNCFCNPCKTYKLMAMETERERERDTANLIKHIKITMDQILTVHWMGKLKSQ